MSNSPRTNLNIVYVKSGNLWISENGSKRELSNSGQDSRPVISPDGRIIVFQRGLELWKMDSAGRNEHRLFSSSGKQVDQFRFDPTSGLVYFSTASSDGISSFDLYVVEEGGNINNLLPVGQAGVFTFSPDGKMISLSAPGKISFYSIDNQKLTVAVQFQPVKIEMGYFLPPVAWLPEVNGFNTVLPPQSGKPALLEFIPLAGGRPAQLAEFAPAALASILLSPDGSKVLYSKNGENGQEMRLVDASTADKFLLRRQKGQIGLIGWLPDSEQFIFWADKQQNVFRSNGVSVSGFGIQTGSALDGLIWIDVNTSLELSGGSLFFIKNGQPGFVIDDGVSTGFDYYPKQ